MSRGVLLSALLLALAAPARPQGAELRGTLELIQEGRRVQGAQEAVVYFVPATPARQASPPPTFEMVTHRKEFKPHTLVVPVGAKVRFPNQDPILHNVFSVSGGNSFDLGLMPKGPGKEATFTEPGLVRVFCNVHQAMTDYVLVLDTPYSVKPDAAGAFRLTGLPAGRGTVSVWHERGEVLSQQVTVPVATPLRLSLPVSKPRVPRHVNKFGKPYRTDGAY
jgi:plastocyanin